MTSELGLSILLALLGALLLYGGAELLLRGGISLAVRLNVSRLVVGLLLAAFVTSLPELFVSSVSAWHKSPDISIGNIIGSNICNVGLILGFCAAIRPMKFNPDLKKFSFPVMVFSMFALVVFYLLTHGINRLEGAFFVLCLGTYCRIVWTRATKTVKDGAADGESEAGIDPEVSQAMNRPLKLPWALILLLAGIVMLIFGTRWFLDAAEEITRIMGFSKAKTGLIFVAVGTSLPELFTSFVASLKGENDIAIGNIIGSNIFNVFCILGVVPLIFPLMGQSISMVDLAVMFVLAGALYLFALNGTTLNRKQGWFLLLIYIAYFVYLWYFRS